MRHNPHISVPSQLGVKHKANKDEVRDRPIQAPTDCQLELLTELRQIVSNLASARRRLMRETSRIVGLVNAMMGLYVNGGMTPASDTLYMLEERMIGLLDEMRSIWAEEEFYRDLKREIFAELGRWPRQ